MSSFHLNFPRKAFLSALFSLLLLSSCGSLFSQESFEATKAKAEAGDAEAQYMLGRMYDEGVLVENDGNKALEWFKKSAAQGNLNGEISLGRLYDKWYFSIGGRHAVSDRTEALKWFLKAADQGSHEVDNEIAGLYISGSDYTAAMKWLLKAADHGSGQAMANIGEMYVLGCGVPSSSTEAVRYYQMSTGAHYPEAARMLGDLYAKGKGAIKKDPVEALAYYYVYNNNIPGLVNDAGKVKTTSLEKILGSVRVLEAQNRAKEIQAKIDAYKSPAN